MRSHAIVSRVDYTEICPRVSYTMPDLVLIYHGTTIVTWCVSWQWHWRPNFGLYLKKKQQHKKEETIFMSNYSFKIFIAVVVVRVK